MAQQLDSRQRKYLKGLAHHLKPVVHVGKDGITNSLVQQIEAALLQHELIKVKLGESSPIDRDEASAQLPAKSGAAFVQNIGRVFVLFRAHPEQPRIELPPARVIEQLDEEEDPSVDAGESAGPVGLPSVRQRGAAPLAPRAPRPASAEGEGDEAAPPRPPPRPASDRPARPSRPKSRTRSKPERVPRKSSKRAVHKRGTGRR